jgi:hypothetical protein
VERLIKVEKEMKARKKELIILQTADLSQRDLVEEVNIMNIKQLQMELKLLSELQLQVDH